MLLGLFYTSFQSLAQDPTFTQFYSNPVYLNPALAGSSGCPRIALNYRNQWPQLTGNYITYAAAYDTYAKNLSGGIGIMAMHDQQGQGTIQTSMIAGTYSYYLKVNRKFRIMFGGQAAYFQKSLDWSKLIWKIIQYVGFVGFFDVSAGMVGFTKNFYFGVAGHHLNRPDESMILGDSKLPIRVTGHMGATIKLGQRGRYSSNTMLMPNIIYQYQNGFQQFNIGAYLKYEAFTIGAWYRNRDAFIVSLGITTEKFRIGYSYDLTVSQLGGVTGGSHEISMGINLKCKKQMKDFRRISCPSF